MILIVGISIISCNESSNKTKELIATKKPKIEESEINQSEPEKMKSVLKGIQKTPLVSLESVRAYIKENFKSEEESLWISDSMNDKVGINMAIIVDVILKAGYMPDGFDQEKGYRIYNFKKM